MGAIMRLTDAEVEHVAELARLGLTADEVGLLRDQLSTILDHIAALNEVDTAAIPPTAQVLDLTNVMRNDDVQPSLPRHAVLANAPRERDGFFEVDAVLTGGDENES
jgi:aspartyl-tRNA(Asn)/glutamyl-tRNA(Gln) amidotransferase subunit C